MSFSINKIPHDAKPSLSSSSFLQKKENDVFLSNSKNSVEEFPLLLDPIPEEKTNPANNTVASGMLAIIQKYLNFSKHLRKYYYDAGAVHQELTETTHPEPSKISVSSSLNSSDSLLNQEIAQIAHQAQEALDKNQAAK